MKKVGFKKSLSVLLHDEMIEKKYTTDEIESILEKQAEYEMLTYDNECTSCGKYATPSVTEFENGKKALIHFGMFNYSSGKHKCCTCMKFVEKSNKEMTIYFSNYNKCLMVNDENNTLAYTHFFNKLTFEEVELKVKLNHIYALLKRKFNNVVISDELVHLI